MSKFEKPAKCELPGFDLSEVLRQIANDPAYAWDKEKQEKEESNYRRFLAVCKSSTRPVIPSLAVDIVWHRHILNTKKYMRDCDSYFGYYLHHQPGNPTDDDRAYTALINADPALAYQDDDGLAGCNNKCKGERGPRKPQPKCCRRCRQDVDASLLMKN